MPLGMAVADTPCLNFKPQGNVMEKPTYGRPASLIAAVGAGALLMYLLDSRQGRRRASLARNRVTHFVRSSRDLIDAGTTDLANRIAGVTAKMRRALSRADPADGILVQRVRAQLGRLVSHPHAIRVSAAAGRVSLAGPIPARQEQQLLQGVQRVHGVRSVENRLNVHANGDRPPSAQGSEAPPPMSRMVFAIRLAARAKAPGPARRHDLDRPRPGAPRHAGQPDESGRRRAGGPCGEQH